MTNAMNNTKKGILIIALLATITGFAKDLNVITKMDAKRTSLVLKNVKAGNQLTIKDNSGVTLYKESIEIDGFYKKGFDLTELPNGDYVFELEKDLEIKTIPFKVAFNRVVFNKADEKTQFKPQVRETDDLVYVSKLNPNMMAASINVYALYDGTSKLCHSEIIENKQVIEKAFKLEKGNYKIVINSDNKEYIAFINN